MVFSGLTDFWRRRRLYIIAALVFLCMVAVFIQVNPTRWRSASRKTSHDLKKDRPYHTGRPHDSPFRTVMKGKHKPKKQPLPLYRFTNKKKDQVKLGDQWRDMMHGKAMPVDEGRILDPKRPWKPDKKLFNLDVDEDTPKDLKKGLDLGEAPEIGDDGKVGKVGKVGKNFLLRNRSSGLRLKDRQSSLKNRLGRLKYRPNDLLKHPNNQPGARNPHGSQEFNQMEEKHGNQFGHKLGDQRRSQNQFNQQGSRSGNQAPGNRNQPGNLFRNRLGNQQPGNWPRNQQPRNQPGNQQPGNWPRIQQPGNQPGNQQPGNWHRNQQPGNQQPGNWPRIQQPRNQPGNQQPGNQPGNQQPGNQPGNQQPGNWPGNQQPGNWPGNQQPGNWPGNQQPGNQPGNQQSGNWPRNQQPGNWPRNQQPGNQRGNQQPGNQPGNQVLENQPPGQNGSEQSHVLNPPGNQSSAGGHSMNQNPQHQTSTTTEQLYVHSTIPLGRPLNSERTRPERQEAVVRAFRHAWKAYVDYAWGMDEVNPVSHTSSSSFNMGLTLIDSLDTMWLMGLEEEFKKARDWVANSFHVERNKNTVSLFETNIRVLGGLLSAYHLSNDQMFLKKAEALGTLLLPAFDTPSGVPSNAVNLGNSGHNGRTITVAEAGTLQLEFRDLARASGNSAYQEACDRAMTKILSQTHGMVPQTLNCGTGMFTDNMFTVGAGTDSFYEYLIKQWIQSGMRESKFRDAYEVSVKDVLRYLVGYTKPSNMAFLGKKYGRNPGPPSTYMDHLSCFYPGMLALGVLYDVLPKTKTMAENVTHTCYHMYKSTSETGLAPEIFHFITNPSSTNDVARSSDSGNIQRPETVESLFYLYRLTKQEKYRDWGWEIFQAFDKYTKLQPSGYTCLRDVYSPKSYRDRTESFFLAETLKYLYLLFGEDDSVLSLKEWVFNTEAHPLPIWKVS